MSTIAQACQQLDRPSAGMSRSRTMFSDGVTCFPDQGWPHFPPIFTEPGVRGAGLLPCSRSLGAVGASGVVLYSCPSRCSSFRGERSAQLKPIRLAGPGLMPPCLLTQKPLLKLP